MLSELNYLELRKYLEPYTPTPEEQDRFNLLSNSGLIKSIITPAGQLAPLMGSRFRKPGSSQAPGKMHF